MKEEKSFHKLMKTFVGMWVSPFGASLLAFMIYLSIALSQGGHWWETPNNYYNYLADAFLHGQLHLRLLPTSTHDLVFYKGNYYLYWPPFPAILLTPLIFFFGIHFSDVLFTIIVGSLNVGLVALLFRCGSNEGILPLNINQRSLLVIFFALGSVQTPLAPFGNIWATGQLVAFLFVCMAYISAITLTGWRAFFITGLALACAMTTRNHTLFAGIWPLYYIIQKHWNIKWNALLGFFGAFISPILFAGLFYLTYNYFRFSNPLDIGLEYHLMDPFFQKDYSQFGAFSIHYIPINIYYQYIYYPFPWTEKSFMGGSIFLLSPLLFSIFWGLWKGRPRLSVLFLLISILITSIPILMLMGTGWKQIGPRYTLDFTVPLLMLAAIGLKYWKSPIIIILTSLSIVQYLLGILSTRHWL